MITANKNVESIDNANKLRSELLLKGTPLYRHLTVHENIFDIDNWFNYDTNASISPFTFSDEIKINFKRHTGYALPNGHPIRAKRLHMDESILNTILIDAVNYNLTKKHNKNNFNFKKNKRAIVNDMKKKFMCNATVKHSITDDHI